MSVLKNKISEKPYITREAKLKTNYKFHKLELNIY